MCKLISLLSTVPKLEGILIKMEGIMSEVRSNLYNCYISLSDRLSAYV